MKDTESQGTGNVPFTIRIPAEIVRRLEEAASKYGTSGQAYARVEVVRALRELLASETVRPRAGGKNRVRRETGHDEPSG